MFHPRLIVASILQFGYKPPLCSTSPSVQRKRLDRDKLGAFAVQVSAMPANAALGALGHAISGSVGTAISTATLYPLDLVTTRLKTQRLEKHDSRHYNGILDAFAEIARTEGGTTALYSGLGPSVAKSMIDSFLFFGIYNFLRRQSRRKPRALQELLIGALAGACARLLTTPISNVVTRKQMMSGKESVTQMLQILIREGGLLSLWSGYSATLILTLNPSITFFVNRRLAAKIVPALKEEDIPIAWVAFFLAATSKAAATAIMYPFQTGKTRLQMAIKTEGGSGEDEGKASNEDKAISPSWIQKVAALLSKTIWGVILRITRQEGLRALYDGIQGELLKSFLSHGLTMVTKGTIHRIVIRLWYILGPFLRKQRIRI